MRIAVVTNLSFDKLKVNEWLSEDGNQYNIFLRTKYKEEVTNRNFSSNIYFHYIENWDNCELEEHIIREHERSPFTKIISFREQDVVRISKIREYLNISGQTEASALLYRDKFVMKQTLQKYGIKVAKFFAVNDYIDCLKAVGQLDFPVILKPRDGGGSMDTFVIKSRDELYNIVKKLNVENYIVEEYIDGEVYHVDVLVTEFDIKYISAARYVNNCLAFKEGKSTASVFYPNNHPVSKKLVEFSKKVLFSLPREKDSIYHIEIFETKDGEFILCEIACRAGGGQIVPIIERCYSLNLYKEYLNAQVYKSTIQLKKFYADKPKGFLLVSPKQGTLLDLPQQMDLPYIEDFEIYGVKGQEYGIPNSSAFALASFEVGGDTIEKVEENLIELDKLFKSKVFYSE